ncbi:MAG: hypothetical protein LBU96_14580 [Yokenella regensburgei]|jgi:hypothetical protein|nr:hypothetical protein [Yokenella regensburgei]
MTTIEQNTTSESTEHLNHLQTVELLRQACIQMKADAVEKHDLDSRINQSAALYADFNFLTSYLAEQVFSDEVIQSLIDALSAMREAVEKHGQMLIDEEIKRQAGAITGEITPLFVIGVLNHLRASEPEHSPYHGILAKRLDDAEFEHAFFTKGD